MITYFITRIINSVVVLLVLSVIVFSLIHLAPGDPARNLLPMEATPEEVASVRRELGLDKPLPVMYSIWLKKAIKLDFGNSITQGDAATSIYFERLPASVELAAISMLLAVLFGIPVGIVCALKKNGLFDFASNIISVVGVAVPKFWLGLIFIYFFSEQWNLLPPFGRGPALTTAIGAMFHGDIDPLMQSLKCLILPSITLASWYWAIFMKYTRSSVSEEIEKLYVKTAKMKGLKESVVMYRHVLMNSLIPIVTIIGVQLSSLVSGAVVVEIVFGWPGVGRLLLTALYDRDYPLIQAILLMIGFVNIVIFITLDLLYGIIDPRIRSNG